MKMKKLSLFALLFVCVVTSVAQQKITVEDIYTGAFRAKGMDELQSMKNTNQYCIEYR